MSSMTLSDFADKVTGIMPVLMREFLKQQSGEFYKMKITMPQFIALDMLTKRKESSMTDLAHDMYVTTAALTGIVDRLVRDGYVMRASDPDDRRIIRIKPTANGEKVVKHAVEERKKATMRIFGMISPYEREQYIKILTHIKDHLNTGAGQR